jgi:hypothetical protein
MQDIKCNDSILDEEQNFRLVVKYHKAEKFNQILLKNLQTQKILPDC